MQKCIYNHPSCKSFSAFLRSLQERGAEMVGLGEGSHLYPVRWSDIPRGAIDIYVALDDPRLRMRWEEARREGWHF